MAIQEELTTLVCLFHHEEQAQAAVRDLLRIDVPEGSVSVIGGEAGSHDGYEKTELASMGMPDKDYDHLKAGLRNGGYVVAVSSIEHQVKDVEKIFASHKAEKIDEADRNTGTPGDTTGDATAIPILEEELQVGKRTVDQGGVRVYRRIIEIPVEESVTLREEHVSVNRTAVDRSVADADRAFRDQTIILTETAEEAVISKHARVIEEITVSKDAVEHTETITDTVRRTEVDIEELPATNATQRLTK